jgi:tRNA (guanosine-2'-O-)-methyltransferase
MSIRTRIKEVKHLRNKYLICVLENPKQSINLASTIRNVSAFGVEKIYVIGGYPGIPKNFEAARNNKHLSETSVGASRWTFIRHFETAADCIQHLKKNLYTIAVTSPHLKGKENYNLYSGKYTQKRLAVWFGNESKGISDEAADNADFCIQIGMGGIVESLNLGTSTGIILSYIREQRLNFVKEKENKKNKILNSSL